MVSEVVIVFQNGILVCLRLMYIKLLVLLNYTSGDFQFSLSIGSMMLISEWTNEWSLYKHASLEHEVSLGGVFDIVVGRQQVALLHLQRSDGKHATLRLRKEEAKGLALLLRNLYPSIMGDH